MDTLIALRGADCVVVAADRDVSRGIVVQHDDVDKIMELDSHKVRAMLVPAAPFCAFRGGRAAAPTRR